jgi:transcriptional regulator with XRE-family HTH domain
MRAAAANGARKIRAIWLRRIRIDRGLTQKKLAEQVNVSTTAISQYEKAIIAPNTDHLDQLLVALECWYVDLLEDPKAPVPPRRPMRRPVNDVAARSIDIVIGEFAHPSRAPAHYPDRMRCWICHGKPGECRCYHICKICGLPFQRGGQCSGILHLFLAGLAADEICCLLKGCLIA